MATLDIEIGTELLKAARRLAVHHYGDGESTSLVRVVETALVMRLLWLDLMGEGGGEVEEPVVGWEAEAAGAPGQAANELREWLFGKEGRDDREGRAE